MIVFKTFFKVVREYKYTILLYTLILFSFAIFNLEVNNNNIGFTAEKPNILIVNNDYESKIIDNLYNYLEQNSNIKNIENDKDKINDALFYRDINYLIIIPKNFTDYILNNKETKIYVKTTKDANSKYMDMLLNRYLKLINIYKNDYDNVDNLISKINSILKEESHIEVSSNIKVNNLLKTTIYYNFANYSLLASCLFVISTVLNSFKQEMINKRIIVSSCNYKKHNKNLFLAALSFSVIIWIIYVFISLILIKEAMFSWYGLLYMFNSFVFMVCALALSFLLGTIINLKEAINGIVNVIALGSSFLCGAFVPSKYLPEFVINISKLLPSYYFINNNEFISQIETFNFNSLTKYFINIFVIIIFIILFIILNNLVSKNKRKTN